MTGGRLAAALAAHGAAVIDRDADAIYAAAQQLEQIGALLLAADAAAQSAFAYEAAGDRLAAATQAAPRTVLPPPAEGFAPPRWNARALRCR